MQELIEKIEQWARDRELDKKGTVEGQKIKTAEEIAERKGKMINGTFVKESELNE